MEKIECKVCNSTKVGFRYYRGTANHIECYCMECGNHIKWAPHTPEVIEKTKDPNKRLF